MKIEVGQIWEDTADNSPWRTIEIKSQYSNAPGIAFKGRLKDGSYGTITEHFLKAYNYQLAKSTKFKTLYNKLNGTDS